MTDKGSAKNSHVASRALVKFCKSLFETNPNPTDFKDASAQEVQRLFSQGEDGLHVRFSVSRYAIGEADNEALDVLLHENPTSPGGRKVMQSDPLALVEFCRRLFEIDLIGTDIEDASVQRPFSHGEDDLHVRFSVSWHAIGKTGKDAHDALEVLLPEKPDPS